ncbi:CTP synthase [Papillibacter cinnamivorans]|uniref:CTP synthase n=1 Tax=Papillibacter cinnamivorans DSM 12816 TaxID=1122930 RepID=A0A1W2AAT8_9FIRM|nr:CTP synthase [Papillibacter cinnamivorans]SMC57592.1 CTP synthase [Papillibacter cinnamivorans DSM 12816]
MSVKYIFVTGGVVSGLGKGITAASLGRLLKERGFRVTIQKFDPYLNVDPGTMSPYQHGEVFVTDDGAETDLDLGHYERFTDESLTVNSCVTSGKIYWSVLSRERCGDFLGGTVQVIPHITNEIKERIYRVGSKNTDIVITEIGGTVGDIESQPFLEAIRQVAAEVGRQDVMYIHVSLVVNIPGSNELKSKPTQHSAKELLSLGIQPDVIVCRSDLAIPKDLRNKISLFCNIPPENVIPNLTAPTLYEVPLMLEKEGLANAVCKRLGLDCSEPDLAEWRAMVSRIRNEKGCVTIGLVGKYVALRDAYLSVAEALGHGGIENDVRVEISWIDSEEVSDENAEEYLGKCDGILVPGGFGDRGIEGKISAARYAREHKIPFFGICLGMQMAVVEFARHVAGFSDAHSSEFNEHTLHPVIYLMPEQRGITEKGGTMRLGSYPCDLETDSRAYEAYQTPQIQERHRHRYEFNNDYREQLTAKGLKIAGLSPSRHLVEIVELADHPWFVGVQFHPEFKSRPNRAHPLFREFIRAAKEHRESL